MSIPTIPATDHVDKINQAEGYTAASTKDFLIQSDSTVTVYTQYFAGSNHQQINS